MSEAAERLGISQGAVRKRIQRGTLPHAKQVDGHVYVFLDSETSASAQLSGTELANQAKLHYIDKLYSAWQSINAHENQFTFLKLVLSVLLLALSGGAVSADKHLAFSGIEVKVPFLVLMTTGAVLIGLLSIMRQSLFRLGNIYIVKIRDLYRSLGLDYSTVFSPAHPFTSGTAVQALNSMFAIETPTLADGTRPPGAPFLKSPVGRLISTAILVILPAAAQAAAGYKTSEFLDKQGSVWVAGSFIILAILTGLASSWAGIKASDSLRYFAYLVETPTLPPDLERTLPKRYATLRRRLSKVRSDPEQRHLVRIPLIGARIFYLLWTLIYVCLGVLLGYFVVKQLPSL